MITEKIELLTHLHTLQDQPECVQVEDIFFPLLPHNKPNNISKLKHQWLEY